MKVFVLLPRQLDAKGWSNEYKKGKVPDETPYGYHHAKKSGCQIDYSAPTPRTDAAGLVDKICNKILGIEFSHVWKNRSALFFQEYDVIWTHTERENLPVLLLQRLHFWRRHTPMISQIVWQVDKWPQLSALQRALYRFLFRRADVLTFHSPENAQEARRLGLNARCELVHFGVSVDSFQPSTPKPLPAPATGRKWRVFALGNDTNRDWQTFSRAFADPERFEVRVGSGNFPDSLKQAHFTVKKLSQAEILEGYAWCDCVVVPLTANLHASGITVLLESVLKGVPAIVTDTGGLKSYFGDDAVSYVPVADHLAMRDAVLNLPDKASPMMLQRALETLRTRQFTSEGFALRHVELSKSLLKPESQP